MRCSLRLFFGLVVAVALAAPVRAQAPVEHSERPVFPCWLPAPEAGQAGHAAHEALPVPDALSRGAGQAAAEFVVTYDGFPSQARAAFQAAVDVWAQHVTSAVPIRIDASWTALATNLLGSAGPFLVRNFPEAPVTGTWYPNPLADAIAGRDINPGGADIEANFNSDFDRWYLGTDGNVPVNQVELFTVVLHELGHGLGFIGSASVEIENGTGTFGLPQASGIPFIYDRFTEDRQGRALLDQAVYPRPSTALGNVLQDAVFFGGGTVEAAYGAPAPLWAPATWNAGSSYSHFDELVYPPDSADGLMTPLIAPGERKRSPGPLLCASLQDIGWTLAQACADLIPDGPPPPPPPPPSTEVFTLQPAGCSQNGTCQADTIVPTSAGDRATFELTVTDEQSVEALLFDTRGRRVATVSLGTVEAGATALIQVETGRLATGLYLLRVVGDNFEATRKVVRLR